MQITSTLFAVVLAVALSVTDSYAASPDLRIFYTSNVRAFLGECACPALPLGGIGRRATFFAEHSDRVPVLKLDGGDFVGNVDPVGRMQTLYLLRAMQEMGYTAIGAGPRDYMYGISFLHHVEKEFAIPLISTNVARADGSLVFAPWIVTEIRDGGRILGIGRKSVDVGIISVLGQDRPPMTNPADPELIVIEPAHAVREAVAELREQTGVIVLMANVHPDKLEELQTIDGVDVVILTRLARIPDGWVVRRENTLVGYSTTQGRSVGMIDLRIENGKVVDGSGSMTMLSPDIPEDSEMHGIREGFERWKLEYQAEHGE